MTPRSYVGFVGATLWLVPIGADPQPCTEEELLEASDYAIEGFVLRIECGEPFESRDCSPVSGLEDDYLPEWISSCIATVEVTRSFKGSYLPGDEAPVAFLKLDRPCVNGTHILPGAPEKDVRIGSKIRYYNAGEDCVYSNLERLEAPFVRGDANEDGSIDLSDPVRLLLVLFVGMEPPRDPDGLDADGNEASDVSDAIYLLDYLFRAGPTPPPPGLGPRDRFTLSVLYDNQPSNPELAADWGFSGLLELEEKRILIDTGANSGYLLSNSSLLGVRLTHLDALVLTHIHSDHVGGLSSILDLNGGIPVYLPESFPETSRSQIRTLGSIPVAVSSPTDIFPGLRSSGELPGSPIEQVLYLRTRRGLVVLTACAHPGIVELVEEARMQTGEDIDLVLGGFHLFKSDDAAVLEAIQGLHALGVRRVAPCHCTGDRACELLRESFGSGYIGIAVGSTLSLEY